MAEVLEFHDAPVFSYPLASADMRYIEIEKRDVYLRIDPEMGLVFQGEISGCGPGCYITLNEILLEFAMSCEGCREDNAASQEVVSFGEHLGEILAAKTNSDITDIPDSEKLSTVFKCILNSMAAKYIENIKENHLEYSLDCCPISECASSSGLSRSVEMAHRAFTALCSSLINALAPDWVLIEPSEEDTNIPIHKIIVASL
ncbi:MAG: hypothetical protein ABUK20_06880 [Anaerolineales bacterium]